MRSLMEAKACIKQNFGDVLIVSALGDMSDFNMIFPRFLLLWYLVILEFGGLKQMHFLTPKL